MQEISRLEKQLRRTEADVDQARRDTDLVRLQLEQAKAETHEEAALRAEEHRQVEHGQQTTERLRGEIGDLQAELGDARVQLGVAAERESHLQGLMDELTHCKHELEAQRDVEQRLKDELRLREDEVVVAGQKVESSEKRYDTLRQEKEDLALCVEQLEARVDAMRGDDGMALQTAHGSLDMLRRENRELQEALMKREAELARGFASMPAEVQERSVKSEEIARLEEELHDREETITQLLAGVVPPGLLGGQAPLEDPHGGAWSPNPLGSRGPTSSPGGHLEPLGWGGAGPVSTEEAMEALASERLMEVSPRPPPYPRNNPVYPSPPILPGPQRGTHLTLTVTITLIGQRGTHGSAGGEY